MDTTTHYDVIVVGGRPAGATLAARLGLAGLRVLLLERSKMPSLPGVSCPIIYASTMHMLDEIGADEGAYAHGTPKIHKMVNLIDDDVFEVTIPEAHGRNYAYAIDRERFDYALWENAVSMPTVEGRQRFSATRLLWDEANHRVIGIEGLDAETRTTERFTADLVVGADGRHSLVAREVKALEFDTHDDYPTSLYYAYWKNAAPFRNGEPAAVAVGRGEGIGFLMMDSADDTVVVAIEGRSELLEPEPGKVEAMYLSLLRDYPVIWKRLQYAERVTDVRGIKKIGNKYRLAGGEGWALVGDAYHQKDPIDGQGIYDALYTSRVLANEIVAWKQSAKPWDEAVAAYDRLARLETYPMYESTLERVRSNLYSTMPKWAMQISKKTWMRWLFEDSLVQEQIGMMLTRQTRPDQAMSAPIFVGAMLKGPLRELSRALDKISAD